MLNKSSTANQYRNAKKKLLKIIKVHPVIGEKYQ